MAISVTVAASTASVATEYATTPACRQMRNVVPGAPYLPEPNRADTRAATPLAGGERSYLDQYSGARRRYAQVFPLLQKIDAEDTAALASLPPDTPRIDLLLDRHLINLIWARATLAIFFEEGRAPPVDYAKAAGFYRKAAETRFVDDRGCTHSAEPSSTTLIHFAGYYAYGVGVPRDPAKARELLQRAGASGQPVLTLLDHNALPQNFEAYLNTINTPAMLADRVEAVENPADPNVPSLMTWIATPDVAIAQMTSPIETAATWASAIAAALVAAIASLWLLHWRRARLEQRSSIYRTAFAAYDVVQGVVGRIGLVASGLVACGTGIWMLLQASVFGFEGPLRFVILVAGAAAMLGGIAKLIEAARFSQTPKDTNVHGAARPAGEKEAQAAARGDPSASLLRDQTFKD